MKDLNRPLMSDAQKPLGLCDEIEWHRLKAPNDDGLSELNYLFGVMKHLL